VLTFPVLIFRGLDLRSNDGRVLLMGVPTQANPRLEWATGRAVLRPRGSAKGAGYWREG